MEERIAKTIPEWKDLMAEEGKKTHANVTITFDSNYTYTVTPTAGADPDATPTVKDVNSVDVYDLSAFNEKTTVFVNPLSGSIYYDEEALSTIAEMNADMMETKYNQDWLEVQERNAAKESAYYQQKQ